MQLGELIAQLEDDAAADEALLALGDLTLVGRITDAAACAKMTRGAFVAASVGRFANHCSDELWLTLLGQMSQAESPGHVFLRAAIEAGLSDQLRKVC